MILVMFIKTRLGMYTLFYDLLGKFIRKRKYSNLLQTIYCDGYYGFIEINGKIKTIVFKGTIYIIVSNWQWNI